MASPGTIESAKQFKNTPQGLQERWTIEIAAAKEMVKPWWEEAEKANKRYLGQSDVTQKDSSLLSRINLYHANVNILLSILFGQIPKVDVSRKFGDAEDDAARVAGEALERHLNCDIEDDADDFQTELKDALKDWKTGGLGQVRLRYTMESEDHEEEPAQVDETGRELVPAVPAGEIKTDEDIETEYVHWRDFLWSPARRWKEVRWVAFMAEMTRDQLNERFGEKLGKQVPMTTSKINQKDGERIKEAWSRAHVWEIWSREAKTVYWYAEGMREILDSKEDPLDLENFFPCPRPLVANLTTSKYLPKPDLELDRAIYDEIDELSTRLRKLVRSARLAGAYDKSFPDLARILEEAQEGQLIGVSGWMGLQEKGGLAGAMQFVPLDPVINAIQVLTQKIVEKIQLLYQVTGISDIVRGQADQKATATEQQIKAKFASTRLQNDQDEVARFASDLQKIRAEIISKHFDEQTIIERSNLIRVEMVKVPNPMTGQVTNQPNMPLIQAAVKLIKSDLWSYRIDVKSDSISLRDYAALKAERVETIQALAGLFQQAIPMVQIAPQSAPLLIELAKWLIASTKGSATIESVFDRFADQMDQAAQAPKPPPPPDPRLQAAQVKAQAETVKAQSGIQQTQVDAQAHMAKTAMDLKAAQEEHAMKMQQMGMKRDLAAPIAPGLPPLPRLPGGPV